MFSENNRGLTSIVFELELRYPRHKIMLNLEEILEKALVFTYLSKLSDLLTIDVKKLYTYRKWFSKSNLGVPRYCFLCLRKTSPNQIKWTLFRTATSTCRTCMCAICLISTCTSNRMPSLERTNSQNFTASLLRWRSRSNITQASRWRSFATSTQYLQWTCRLKKWALTASWLVNILRKQFRPTKTLKKPNMM